MLAGWDAAPAGGARNPAPGRPRAAVRPYYEGPPSLAGRGADEGGRKPAGSGARLGPRPRPEVTAPGTEKPLWSAERRPHPSKEDAARRKTGAPLGAPPPRFSRGTRKAPFNGDGTTAYPAPQRIRAMTLGLSRRSAAKAGCLKIKSESGASYRRRCRRAE
jgi:hypothetical protein